jgi:hypothetical protein
MPRAEEIHVQRLVERAYLPIRTEIRNCYAIRAHHNIRLVPDSNFIYYPGFKIEAEGSVAGVVVNAPDRSGYMPEVETYHFVRRTGARGVRLVMQNYDNATVHVEAGTIIAHLYFTNLAEVHMMERVPRELPRYQPIEPRPPRPADLDVPTRRATTAPAASPAASHGSAGPDEDELSPASSTAADAEEPEAAAAGEELEADAVEPMDETATEAPKTIEVTIVEESYHQVHRDEPFTTRKEAKTIGVVPIESIASTPEDDNPTGWTRRWRVNPWGIGNWEYAAERLGD